MIKQVPFTLIDVGASGGIQDKWQTFESLQFYGFEPDDRATSDVQKKGRETWINCGVAGTQGTFTFNMLRAQCNSSLLKPNMQTISRLAYDPQDFDVVREVEVPCDTLDNICQKMVISPDIIKLDTQGTEHEILNGADTVLSKDVLAAEIEVEFLPLYENQKLFADVDVLMREKGFILMDLGNQLYMKGKSSVKFNQRKGYLVAADALYFLSIQTWLERLATFSDEKILAFMPVCKAYGYLNYAYELFTEIRRQAPERYNQLSSNGDILEQIVREIPGRSLFAVSERKYSKVREFFEKRIKTRNANWNYGLGNPTE